MYDYSLYACASFLSLYPCSVNRMWLRILLLVTLNAAITDGQYTHEDIHRIVQHIQTMVKGQNRFPGFPEQDHRQYGFILLLPPKTENQPQIDVKGPAQLIRNNHEYMLLGVNFAVARPHGNFAFHTETQLLNHLPDLLDTYRKQYQTNPTILLYTRATPCGACTRAIKTESDCMQYFGHHWFVVAYSTNMISERNGMNYYSNCKNRLNLRRNKIAVYCVPEPYTKQCMEDDNKTCGIPRRWIRTNRDLAPRFSS